MKWLLLLLVVCCVGCDHQEARAKCDGLVTTLCERRAACPAGAQPATQAVCVAELGERLDCARAGSVSTSYDACLTALEGMTCEDFKPPGAKGIPEACREVILTD